MKNCALICLLLFACQVVGITQDFEKANGGKVGAVMSQGAKTALDGQEQCEIDIIQVITEGFYCG